MLLGELFTIQSIQKRENSATAIISINSEHPIFEGHFPGQPVLPGACQLQILKDILQTMLNIEIQLVTAHQLKFLSVIDPRQAGVLQMDITHQTTAPMQLTVTAALLNDGVSCFKFNGVFEVHLRDAW